MAIAKFEGEVRLELGKIEAQLGGERLEMGFTDQLMKKWQLELEKMHREAGAELDVEKWTVEKQIAGLSELMRHFGDQVVAFGNQLSGISVSSEDITA
jgi:hypothetical protein